MAALLGAAAAWEEDPDELLARSARLRRGDADSSRRCLLRSMELSRDHARTEAARLFQRDPAFLTTTTTTTTTPTTTSEALCEHVATAALSGAAAALRDVLGHGRYGQVDGDGIMWAVSGEAFYERRFEEGADVLESLFLTGRAVERRRVAGAVGVADLETLECHGLVVVSLRSGDDDLLIGCFQVYPLPEGGGYACTDWPVESYRPRREAVMAVGYDSLELAFAQRAWPAAAVLDAFCGCGIQAFVALGQRADAEATCVDVNPRACRFALFNAALNGVQGRVRHVLCGDAFAAIRSLGPAHDLVLANPPFVALPPALATGGDDAAPPLYATPGTASADGVIEALVRQVAGSSCDLLCVTELSNTATCDGRVIDWFGSRGAVDVAHCLEEVETAREYAEARRSEYAELLSSDGGGGGGGDNDPLDDNDGSYFERWLGAQGVIDRALVVLACKRGANSSRTKGSSRRHVYGAADPTNLAPDELLTTEGRRFLVGALRGDSS